MRLYFTFLILYFLPVKSIATTYYLSPTGSDLNSGTSITEPWQTISKINIIDFNGDTILFEGGNTFTGNIDFTSLDSGTAAKPIVIGSYGNSKATISSG